MILKTIALKVVVPTALTGGAVGGGGYVAYSNWDSIVPKESSESTKAANNKDTFSISLGGQALRLDCSQEALNGKSHWNIELKKQDANSAVIKCLGSDSEQSGSSLKIYKTREDGQEIEDQEQDTDPIGKLECSNYGGESPVRSFTCSYSPTSEIKTELKDKKILFSISKDKG